VSAVADISTTIHVNKSQQYCLILEDRFTTINPSVWNYEIQRGGFGTGTFEWTTNDTKNAYVDDAGLHIVPTLTTESTSITLDQLTDGFVLNLSYPRRNLHLHRRQYVFYPEQQDRWGHHQSRPQRAA
jgi:hypothetical protein